MGAPVMCECGAVLVKDVDQNGVVTIDGDYVPFKRKTDFIACASCLRSYPARDILPPRPEPEQPVERIERMLEEEA